MPYTVLQDLSGSDGFDRISIDIAKGDDADAVAASLLTRLNAVAGDKNAYTVTDIDLERKNTLGYSTR